MLDRQLKVAGRDEEVFRHICEFMLDSVGQPPRIDDLVDMANNQSEAKESVSRGTISRSISRLAEMGLITVGRAIKKRSARSIGVNESRFYIDIGEIVTKKTIREFHEELARERNTTK